MVSRRRFLSTAAATTALLPARSGRVTALSRPSKRRDEADVVEHFVETDGTDFVVDGETVHFSGGNHPQLRRRDDLIEPFFNQWDAHAPDLNALRIPAFATGMDRPLLPLHPEPGEYNEEGFLILDEIIAECKRRDIRLILILSNFWDWGGGVPQYVDWVADADTKEDFYNNPQVRQLFRDYVEFVLTWENTKTGVPYKKEPTIAMWELMNEPRVVDDPSSPVEWIAEMSSFIKSLETNHLVSPGIGGGRAWMVPDWYWDVYELDSIDVWSFHVWADRNHQDIGRFGGQVWIRNHTDAAHSLSMPAYCGEFGWRVDPRRSASDVEAQIARRNEVFGSWYETMDEVDTNGAVVWDLRADEEFPLEWNPYAVYPRDIRTAELVGDWSTRFAEKSTPVSEPEPEPQPEPVPELEPPSTEPEPELEPEPEPEPEPAPPTQPEDGGQTEDMSGFGLLAAIGGSTLAVGYRLAASATDGTDDVDATDR